jgi:hypothetical protein
MCDARFISAAVVGAVQGGTAMSLPRETPFDSIEDAHQFIRLLHQAISETRLDIEADVQRESNSAFPRRLQAMQMTLYTLKKLEFHMQKSGRILNDLRTLRRLLFGERSSSGTPSRKSTTAQHAEARRTSGIIFGPKAPSHEFKGRDLVAHCGFFSLPDCRWIDIGKDERENATYEEGNV